MNPLRSLRNCWFGLVYRWQTRRRLDSGIHRSAAASRRTCVHCLGCAEGRGVQFRRCTATALVVHRGDICRRFRPHAEG